MFAAYFWTLSLKLENLSSAHSFFLSRALLIFVAFYATSGKLCVCEKCAVQIGPNSKLILAVLSFIIFLGDFSVAGGRD